MNKFRPERRSYFQTGVSGYIGSGSNPILYSKRAAPSFAKLRQIYGNHLEEFSASDTGIITGKELSPELKEKIRRRFKLEHRRSIFKHAIALVSSIAILVALVYFGVKLFFFVKEYFST